MGEKLHSIGCMEVYFTVNYILTDVVFKGVFLVRCAKKYPLIITTRGYFH